MKRKSCHIVGTFVKEYQRGGCLPSWYYVVKFSSWFKNYVPIAVLPFHEESEVKNEDARDGENDYSWLGTYF